MTKRKISSRVEEHGIVITESEMMLWCSVEQVTETNTEAVELVWGPAAANEDGRLPSVEAVCQQTHTALMTIAHHDATDIVASSRKNHSEGTSKLQKTFDPTTGGSKRNFRRTTIRVSLRKESQEGIGS